MTKQHLDFCRWCGGSMIPSPDGGHGIMCQGCWWPSGECRCPIRPDLVTEQTPQQYITFRACGHGWTEADARDEHGHHCGRPFEHNGRHACSACDAIADNPASFIEA